MMRVPRSGKFKPNPAFLIHQRRLCITGCHLQQLEYEYLIGHWLSDINSVPAKSSQFREATSMYSSHHEHRSSVSSHSSSDRPHKHNGHHHHPSGPPPGVDPQVWHWFKAVDTDRSGYITADELQTALVNGMLFHHEQTR